LRNTRREANAFHAKWNRESFQISVENNKETAMFTLFNHRISRALVAAILPMSMGLTMASNGIAETSPFDPQPNQLASEPQRLTMDNVAQMLQTLGIAFEKSDSGLTIKAKDKDGMTFSIVIVMGQSKEYIWFDCTLVKADQTNVQELLSMLTANQKYGIATFCVDAGYIELQMSVPNSGVTADQLRTQLKAYFDTLVGSKPLWNTQTPPPAQPTNPFGS
jgi:hypothetical protein